MKQTFKKKPEYLDAVIVEDDTQSIRDVYEFAEVTKANITFENGERLIELEDGTKIPVNSVIFKDRKSGKIIVTNEEKLLQYYDIYNSESD